MKNNPIGQVAYVVAERRGMRDGIAIEGLLRTGDEQIPFIYEGSDAEMLELFCDAARSSRHIKIFGESTEVVNPTTGLEEDGLCVHDISLATQPPAPQPDTAELDELVEQLAEIEAALEQEKTLYATRIRTLQHDYDRLHERTQQELAREKRKAENKVFDRVFETLDNIDQGLVLVEEDEGLLIIRRQLQGLLDAYGIKEMQTTGEPFDPNYHHAIQVTSGTDVPVDHVAQTIQKGYSRNGELLRPACVVVSK